MKYKPLISIIIPVYNVESYLSYTINSIINQDFSNWELILVNDGSVDNSGAICDAYHSQDTRVRVIHQNNSGVTKARSAGVSASNGAWIIFIDGDDYIDSNMLSSLYNMANTHCADIVFTPYVINNDNKEINLKLRAHGVYNKAQYLWHLSNANIPLGIGGKLINKRLFDEQTFDISPQITHNEDLLMNFLLSKHLKNIYCESRSGYYHYVQHDSSTTHRKIPGQDNWIELYKSLRNAHMGRPALSYIINSIDERFERGDLDYSFWKSELKKIQLTLWLPIHTYFNYLYVKFPNLFLFYIARCFTKLSKLKYQLLCNIRYYVSKVLV